MIRSFDLADQMKFAALSGDANPAHVDPVGARRTLFGGAAVHGIHLLLWLLETRLRGAGPARLVQIGAEFVAPVLVGEAASFELQDKPAGGFAGRIEVRGVDAVRLRAEIVADAARGGGRTLPPVHTGPVQDRGAADLETYAGTLDLGADPAVLVELFPALSRALPTRQIAVLLALSRLVGMECPGLHSILASLKVRFGEEMSADRLECATRSWRPDFRLLQLSAAADGVEAEVTAFVRPPPVLQPTMAEVRRRIAPTSFADRQAIVIGGSRGLGQVAAKILAAGGAGVRLSYHQGRADALAVVDEILQSGGRADAFPLDVSTDQTLPAAAGGTPTDLLYFATPRIVLNETARFQPALFRSYAAFYVEHFYALTAHFAGLPGGRRRVFYPSTEALDRILPKAAAYASAKAAGEALCRHLPRMFGNLDVVCERLPRVLTDQTASVLPVEGAAPLDTMLWFLTARPIAIENRPHSET